jgi:geranylgeranylglycerol-phosphate geranylgeranyltransferase
MDIEGDLKRGSRSIAIRKGKQFALRMASFVFALVVFNSIIPYVLGWLGIGYLILVIIMDLALLYFTSGLLKSRTPDEGRSFMRRIYLVTLFGMLAYIAGKA